MRLSSVLLSAALLLPLPLAAQTTNYTYTGPDFTTLITSGGESQVFTTNDFVSVDFTLSAPLADNLTFADAVTPTSFTFSDVYQTFTNLTASFSNFLFTTNASGAITGWTMYAGTTGSVNDQVYTDNTPTEAVDSGVFDSSYVPYSCPPNTCYNYYTSEGTVGSYVNNPPPQGSWTITTVPEFSSPLYAIISTAALAFGFVVRRRLVPGLHSSTQIAS